MHLRQLLSLLGALALLVTTVNAQTTYTVSSSADSGASTLRDAVSQAAPGDTIQFSGLMTITLLTPIPVTTDDLLIVACQGDVVLMASGLFAGLELDGVTGCEIRGLRMAGFDPALKLVNGANMNTLGGTAPCDRIEIQDGGDGILIEGWGTTDNVFLNIEVRDNQGEGIYLSSGASYNKFGDGTPAGAVFSHGNGLNGVKLECLVAFPGYTERNEFRGCLIGTDLTGSAASGNVLSGVLLDGVCVRDNLFSGCVLSGNGAEGILIRNQARMNSVEGCRIGTDQSASAAIPNMLNGVLLDCGASDNVFEANVLGGNSGYGVAVVDSACYRNEFKGNVIGLDASLSNALPNSAGGVLVSGSLNRFGGVVPGEGNYICANAGWGVEVRESVAGPSAYCNQFLGNTIGMSGLGNSSGGVFLNSGSVVTYVGGTPLSSGGMPGNNILNNGGPGVLVEDALLGASRGNQILTNSISDNAGLGIELRGMGNCQITPPLITGADSAAGVSGYATGGGFTMVFPCRIQVFRDSDDEGLEFLGETWVTTGYGFFNIPATSLAAGDRVTATQTALYGCPTMEPHTSPFSTPMTAISVGALDCFCVPLVAPCLNADPNAGCENSTGSGATLKAHGSTSVNRDDLTLSAELLPKNSFAMLLGSRAKRNVPFRDGRLCVGGSGVRIFRFRVRNSGELGATVYGDGLVARSQLFNPLGRINMGDTWYFQTFYRDSSGPCASGGNLTNNVEIAFTP